MDPRNVCIPVDGSENSQRAYDWYKSNIAQPQDHLIILHVVEPPSIPEYGFAGMTMGLSKPSIESQWNQIVEETNKRTSQLQAAWTGNLDSDKVTYQYKNVVSSSPGEAIVDAMEELNCHTAVMGSRGLGMVRRTIFGSVSDYVLHHSHKPIIIIPPEKV